MEFAQRYGPWALIAGASEGVGASAARLLAARGINVVLVGRRAATLDELAATLPTETLTIAQDLDDPDATSRLASATAHLEVGCLIYNAGGAGAVPPSEFLARDLDHWQAIVNRNCAMVAATAHHFGAGMVQRGRGGIVFVGSTSCWAGTPGLAIYGATKAFQLLLAEGLWAELRPHGVDVLAMVIGKTATPAYQRLLQGNPEADDAADPDDVAREMLDSLANGPTWPPGPPLFADLSRRDAVGTRSVMKSRLFADDAR